MTKDQIELIEKETGIKLPAGYKHVLLNYPSQLLGTEAEDFCLLNDHLSIIEENTDVKQHGFFGEPWPEHYFVIGINGCGDYYVINHQNEEFAVGFACHEQMACNPYASSLSEFVVKSLDEINN